VQGLRSGRAAGFEPGEEPSHEAHPTHLAHDVRPPARAGCTTDDVVGPDTTTIKKPVQGTAELALSAEGGGVAALKITGSAAANGKLATEKAVNLSGAGTALVAINLTPAQYKFKIEAFADTAMTIQVGSTTVDVSLNAGETTQVKIKLQVDKKADVKSDASGSFDVKGSASFSVHINTAPSIETVKVEFGGASLGLSTDLGAKISVTAKDAEGSSLKFFWSGLGTSGTVEGSASATVSAKALAEAGGKGDVVVVVQDNEGAATALDIKLDAASSATGSAKAEIVGSSAASSASASANAKQCLEAHASCELKCEADAAAAAAGSANSSSANALATAAAKAACEGKCGLSLAGCVSASLK
jgi:hypothetical protein